MTAQPNPRRKFALLFAIPTTLLSVEEGRAMSVAQLEAFAAKHGIAA